MSFLKHFSREEVRNVLNELERRPLMFTSDVTFSSVLSHVSSYGCIFSSQLGFFLPFYRKKKNAAYGVS